MRFCSFSSGCPNCLRRRDQGPRLLLAVTSRKYSEFARRSSQDVHSRAVEEREPVSMQRLRQPFASDSSQWWGNRSSKHAGQASSMEWLGQDSSQILHNGATTRLRRILEFDQAVVGHLTCSWGTTSTIAAAFEKRPREEINKNSPGDVRKLCKAGRLKEALHILNQCGMQAVSKTYVCLLQECINMKALAEGKEVHAHIIQTGFKANIFLLNTLINMYVKCGSIVDARQVFDRMSERDTFSWTMMMGGYAKHGHAKEAFKIYGQMQQEGVSSDRVTFICALNVCANLGTLEEGKEVHADIIKAGILSYINLENTLVDMYAKCGSMKDAHRVFDNMAKRDVVSWNTMITGYAQHGFGSEALKIYEQMQHEAAMPDRVTFICVLSACANLGTLEKGKEIHADIIKAVMVPGIMLETALVDMYAKCGSIKDARQVFDNMTERNVVSWNALITGYAQCGCGREAFNIYEEMQWEGVTPNNVTFICILNACTSLGALEKGKEVHTDIIKTGIASDVVLDTALVDMYAKCGSIMDARHVFDNMTKRNVISWSAMIAGYVQHGCGREAVDIYDQMRQEGITPDRVTFICVLNASASLGALEKGKEVHADIIKAGILSCMKLENSLVDMYAKCGSMKDAHQVFDSMTERDVVSWNAMIGGYAQLGHGREAFKLYEHMQQEPVRPDRVTFIGVLNACANLGALEIGKEIHATIVDAEFAPYINLENTIVDMYAKCGSIRDARHVFNNMSERDAVSWSVMIAGCAQHGCGREALQLFKQMRQEGLKPNGITFLSVLSACGHVGLVDEGLYYFRSMSRDHGLTPTMEHFGSVVDLLGRAGRLIEAEDFINKMPVKPDASVWGAFLGACRIHGNAQFAERAATCFLSSKDANMEEIVSQNEQW